MVGGQAFVPAGAPLEQVFARVLANWLAFGPQPRPLCRVARYVRPSEKELILCNQFARRQALLDLGGFNEALYPNEENALMDELQKRGGKLIYDPQLLVHRRPRSSLKSFARMLMTYGRGRASSFACTPPGLRAQFCPPALLLVLTRFGASRGADSHRELWLMPLDCMPWPSWRRAGSRSRWARAPKPRRYSPHCADPIFSMAWFLARDSSQR